MKIFLPPLDIGETEGFTASKDIFGRAIHGKRLTNLISRVDQPLVIAVDAQWGGGKTTFLKMWAGELRKSGFPVVYFDAFEHDYTEDAFSALASEVIGLSKKLNKAGEAMAKKFFKASLNAGKVVIRSGLKVGVKAATLGALDTGDFKDLAKEIGSEFSSIEDKYIGELLTRQQADQDVILGFRSALSDLPSLLTGPNADAPKPLIFIIDELDRCKPNFALDLLERVKHFFAVPNVHFILGVHIKQLSNSVKLAYGSEVDADAYLQKFISMVFHLMDREQHERDGTIVRFINHLVKAMEFAQEDSEFIESSIYLIRQVASANTLSLRALERIFSVLALSLAFTPKQFFRPPALVAGLCVLKVLRPDLFARAKRGSLSYKEANSILHLEESKIPPRHMEFWQVGTGHKSPDSDWVDMLARYDLEPGDMIRVLANDVVDRMLPTQT